MQGSSIFYVRGRVMTLLLLLWWLLLPEQGRRIKYSIMYVRRRCIDKYNGIAHVALRVKLVGWCKVYI